MKRLTKKDWAKLKANDLQSIAYHEAAHWAVARHFGLIADIRIEPTPGGASIGARAYTGQLRRWTKTTPFRHSVICWAGPIMENALSEANHSPEMAVGLLKDDVHLWDAFDYLEFMQDEMSATDRAGMNGHPARNRAFKTAARIIVKHWPELKREAEWAIAAHKG